MLDLQTFLETCCGFYLDQRNLGKGFLYWGYFLSDWLAVRHRYHYVIEHVVVVSARLDDKSGTQLTTYFGFLSSSDNLLILCSITSFDKDYLFKTDHQWTRYRCVIVWHLWEIGPNLEYSKRTTQESEFHLLFDYSRASEIISEAGIARNSASTR